MPPLVSIIGNTGSGKTSLIEKMTEYYMRSGHKIAAIKHTTHGFNIDNPGKDTQRYRDAGAWGTTISNGQYYAVISQAPGGINTTELAAQFFTQADLVFIEGDKGSSVSKIEIMKDPNEMPLYRRGIKNIIARVRDSEDNSGLPVFRPYDIKGIAEFINRRIIVRHS